MCQTLREKCWSLPSCANECTSVVFENTSCVLEHVEWQLTIHVGIIKALGNVGSLNLEFSKYIGPQNPLSLIKTPINIP